MSIFIKFKPTDIISTRYKAYPSYSLTLSGSATEDSFRSDYLYLETNGEPSTIGRTRYYSDINGNPIESSWNFSGAIEFVRNQGLSPLEKRSIGRLRSIYASGSFSKSENYTSSSIFSASSVEEQYTSILNIPSIYYGSEIKPNSFSFSLSGGLTLTDDGFGGIMSNSILIGSIFYQHGIVALGHHFEALEGLANFATVSFSGTNEIPCTMYQCSAPKALLNFSSNPTFFAYSSSSNEYEITTKEPETFITTVGLYDEDYNLLGVAKVSKPIMNKEDISILFRLKLNY